MVALLTPAEASHMEQLTSCGFESREGGSVREALRIGSEALSKAEATHVE